MEFTFENEIKKLTNKLEEAMNEKQKITVVINMAKWEAARAWCKNAGIVFRVITEEQMFHNGNPKAKAKRR